MTWDEAIDQLLANSSEAQWPVRVNACLWMLEHRDEFDSPRHGLATALKRFSIAYRWKRWKYVKTKQREYNLCWRIARNILDTSYMPDEYPGETVFDYLREHLRPKDYELLYRHFVEEVSFTQIAQEEGVTPQAVSYRFRQLVPKLRRLLS